MSKMQMNNYLCLLIACTFLLVSACKQKDAAGDQPVVISKHTIPVNTDNIDKTVTDSLGGAGFENLAEGLGWETNTNFNTYNNVSAPKGGSFHMSFPEYPSTLRTVGRDSRNRLNNLMQNLVYQPLLGLDSETMEYIPNLATHWKISEDKMTYWFRLDPNAKWSDGQPVVAKDVIATWDLMRDEGIESPSENETYGKFERPEEVSKYIIKVPNKEENWRNFLYFSVSMAIFPNHYLEKIDGKNFLTKYDEQMMPSTGPYTYDGSASKEGELIVLKRRDDFWAKDYSVNKGLFNFDQLKFSFVADDRLALEKVKKGEFDFHTIQRAQWWKEELTADKDDNLKRNLLQKVKVFNFKPAGTQSLMLNTLEPPFDDINVRKAMGHLWNIEESVEKLMYNEYERCVSYYQGSVYQNKSNEVALYNPDKAVALLAKAGYTKKAGEKWLSKDGKRLEIDLRIASKSTERVFTPYQEDLEKVGIKLNLVNMTRVAAFEKMLKREFNMHYVAWTGLVFPNPETSMHSQYSKALETNNVTGMAIPKIDELCEKYDQSYDVQERIKIIQEIDKLATDERHVVFAWVAPYAFRAIYWNKFGIPKTGAGYTDDYIGAMTSWWYDADRAAELEKAKNDESITMPANPVEYDHWGRKGAVKTSKP